MRRALVALFVLACAPPSSLPPPVLLAPGGRGELGVGVSQSVSVQAGGLLAQRSAGQLWFTRRYTNEAGGALDLGFVGFGGNDPVGFSSFVLGAGGMLRLLKSDARQRVVGGLELQLGYPYATLGLPLALRLGQEIWIYTAPTVTSDELGYLRVPLGLSLPLSPQLSLGVEAGAILFSELSEDGGVLVYSALGISRRREERPAAPRAAPSQPTSAPSQPTSAPGTAPASQPD